MTLDEGREWMANFARQIDSAEQRLKSLLRRTLDASVVDELIEELATAIEESRVGLEELNASVNELAQERQRAERERARYEQLFEFAPDGYVVTDTFGLIREANKAAALLLDAGRSRLIGAPLGGFIHPNDRDVFAAHMNLIARTPPELSHQWETRVGTGPGSRFIAWSAMAFREGSAVGLRWQLRDISDRVAADVQTLEWRRRYEVVADVAADVAMGVRIDPDGVATIEWATDGLRRITGWDVEDVRADPSILSAMIWDPDRAAAEEAFKRLSVAGASERWTGRVNTRRGASKLLEVSARRILEERGQTATLIVTARDITDQHEAIRALHSSETRFRAIADRARDMIFRLSLRPLSFDYVSPSAESLLGVTPARLMADATAFLELVHPDDRPLVRAVFDAPCSASSPLVHRIVTAGGDERWFETHTTPEEDESGTIVSLVGVARDITSRVLATQDLRSMLLHEQTAANRLRLVDETRTTFVRALSHDLRRPISMILGLSEEVESNLDRPREVIRQSLQRIQAQSLHLAQIVNDLLNVDRLSEDASESTLTPTPVANLLENLVRAMDVDTPIEIDCSPELRVPLDRGLTSRVLENLLSNAVRHTNPGTTVRISAEMDPQGILFRVIDAGPGISDDNKQLYRRNQPLRAPTAGLGLGLMLVAGFVRLMQGRTWIEDVPGGGACLCVLLPAGGTDTTIP